MTTKGTWHRPHDKKAFNDNFDRIFNDALKTDSKESGRHLEEAADLSDEMRLIQQKMGES